ncbi:MAG: UDP-N-acetylmuramoyl-tripeptide--D-alanyl-D-alanine ligase [Melioribacteraceae bacterium]|nr:UDP-N-acetylmuramoyl-tripeptide--D-alanyl-D-alanine ligase [Melioribacteraceae bacterium]MCF8354520.1 UDP-N-acetylmuramoyl-tripeptide--D-alanyl-D-alanine ligase [Melioribacteraceae bacterium]MCF8394289.1 UDP-N-acetylmuramoyl-tripeptide--D-alanyl-D-alanine ligase [Melioribacteraceae bacterium]MCF8418189.1 UDP-N-acetylmuramoyl-tripeptide--D-alanyl-D-alanine ligase [Melioribacteraceae bacterium]
MKITIEDIFNIPTAVIYNPDKYKSTDKVSIDSRTIKRNSIFFAIKGENFDGHKFVMDAVKRGATTVVVNKNRLRLFDKLDITIITVKDTTKAFGALANIWRNKLNTKVIGITGSNGKTSTKEITAVLLSEKFNVVKSIANNNNHIGVPLTIFDANSKTDVMVLEHGTNHFGEIEYTAKISEPDISVITNIGDSHLEYLIDRDGVYREKSALLTNTKNEGMILINNDDPVIKRNTKKITNKKTFGFRGKTDIKASVCGYTDNGRTILNIESNKMKLDVKLPLYGFSNALNYLTAVAIAQSIGLPKRDILNGTKKLNAVKGRLDVKEFDDFILIDDAYNANPNSMIAAFELVKRIKSKKRKIAILSDMLELGKNVKELHANLSEHILRNKINEIYLTGKYSKQIYDLVKNKKVTAKYFRNKELLSKHIAKINLSGSVVLVKASRGMGLQTIVEQIEKRAA